MGTAALEKEDWVGALSLSAIVTEIPSLDNFSASRAPEGPAPAINTDNSL